MDVQVRKRLLECRHSNSIELWCHSPFIYPSKPQCHLSTRTIVPSSFILAWEIKRYPGKQIWWMGWVFDAHNLSSRQKLLHKVRYHVTGSNLHCPANRASHAAFVSKADARHLCKTQNLIFVFPYFFRWQWCTYTLYRNGLVYKEIRENCIRKFHFYIQNPSFDKRVQKGVFI